MSLRPTAARVSVLVASLAQLMVFEPVAAQSMAAPVNEKSELPADAGGLVVALRAEWGLAGLDGAATDARAHAFLGNELGRPDERVSRALDRIVGEVRSAGKLMDGRMPARAGPQIKKAVAAAEVRVRTAVEGLMLGELSGPDARREVRLALMDYLSRLETLAGAPRAGPRRRPAR